ncbi:hypothetical protein SS50377_25169 [Spironucleus salmonicida]|uniref:Uncharacterized protein n=1 Tax=Spironucleus salmonicida TaxID=348837 RepID=V6LSX9_9EUKA|nr:hypothetical protein SS50377_25169 [Spironucleus salmonicida]|eukprot:EST46801.1 Hypothetical protein SS50377_13166 [Spironucleus salmonicida]
MLLSLHFRNGYRKNRIPEFAQPQKYVRQSVNQAQFRLNSAPKCSKMLQIDPGAPHARNLPIKLPISPKLVPSKYEICSACSQEQLLQLHELWLEIQRFRSIIRNFSGGIVETARDCILPTFKFAILCDRERQN